MAIDFVNIASPQELTTSLAILLVFIFGMILFAGLRLRSPFVLFVWCLMIIVFILTFVTNLAFIWFWVIVILCVISIVIASTVQFMM